MSNIKGLYRDLLDYFATRQDKMFVLITTPPSISDSTTPESAANLRAINTWLVFHWLDDYPYNNVFVFDYYNVLTSNGGSPYTSDLGAESGNHHRYWNGEVQWVRNFGSDYLAYPSDGDNHPTEAGHLKATGEFVDLLNIAYHCWKSDGGCPSCMGRSGPLTTPPPTASPTATSQPKPSPPSQTSPIPAEVPRSSNILVYLALSGILIGVIGAYLVRRRGRKRSYPSPRKKADERLEKLEKALLEGRISQETYEELRKKYEDESR